MVGFRSVLVERGCKPMMKRLRLALAFFLALSVVLSSPGAAVAATSGVWNFGLSAGGVSGSVPGNGASCQVPWAVNAGGVIPGASARCDGGPDYSIGLCQPFEGDCGSYGLVLKDANGLTCGSAGGDPYDTTGNDIRGVAQALGLGYVPVTWETCEPVQACLSYYFDDGGMATTDTVQCIAVEITAPVEATGDTCPYGAPSVPVYRAELLSHSNYLDTYSFVLTIDGVDVQLGTGTGAQYKGWTFATVQDVGGEAKNNAYRLGDPKWDDRPSPGVLERESNFNNGTDPHAPDAHDVAGAFAYFKGAGIAPNITGVQVWYSDSPLVGATWNGDGNSNPNGWTSPSAPPTGPGPFAGVNDPGNCRFYFGPKMHNWAGTDIDEPSDGTVQPPVDYDQPPVVIDPPTDQPTDEPSLWGAILAVLRSIWGAIKGIVSGILSGLRSLFVPNGDGWDIADTRDQLKTKPPFSVANHFIVQGGNFADAYGGAGDCGVLMTFGNSQLSCATIRATPGIGGLYNLVGAGLIGLTLLGAFRMVHRTFEAAS